MKFKKLLPQLVSGIVDAGYDKDPRDIQGLSMPKIKSGADLFIIAPEGAGKSTAIVMGVIQKLKSAFEQSPRAIIMVASKEKAFELEAQFELLGKDTNLRTFTVFDQGILQYQKDVIYEGLDVLIGTPVRLIELLKVTGIPLTNMKMFVVDDAERISLNNYGKFIYRIADSIEKAQYIIVAKAWNENFDRITERIMKNPTIAELA